MSIENIKLRITEIQKKINTQEQKLFNLKIPISILEIDVQMMYIRILYSQYLALQSLLIKDNDISADVQKLENIEDIDTQKKEKQIENQLSIESLFDFENKKEVEKLDFDETEKIIEEKTEVIIQPIIDEPIEVDMDNLEFVEEDEEEEDDDNDESKDDTNPYKETFFPQINPMIDDKEPEIAIPTTKEILHKIGITASASHTVSDIYKKETTEINEQFSNKQNNSIANKLQKNQTNDLMKAIDVNDKFLFIRELFNGNGSLFTEVLNKINELSKITEAIEYFETIKSQYRWKEESDAYKKMYELILKKFSNKVL